MEFDFKHLQAQHPATWVIAGPTGSGKTEITFQLLENWKTCINIENVDVLKVIWYYGIGQSRYSKSIKNVEIIYIKDKPSENDIDLYQPNLIVLDDLMDELKNDETLAKIFTRVSHHRNVSVIFIIQNLFQKGSQMRTISVNAQYIILTE